MVIKEWGYWRDWSIKRKIIFKIRNNINQSNNKIIATKMTIYYIIFSFICTFVWVSACASPHRISRLTSGFVFYFHIIHWWWVAQTWSLPTLLVWLKCFSRDHFSTFLPLDLLVGHQKYQLFKWELGIQALILMPARQAL